MHVRKLVIVVALTMLAAWNARAGEEKVLTLATTTSTENSGLLAHIHPDFEKKTGIKIRVVAKGTGASLQLARDGNADVVLVHARALEEKFMADGHGKERRDVMHNDFVIIGPADDPAKVKQAKSAAEALKAIAESGKVFVSRGDNSGTHVKEQELWQASGLELETATTEIAKGEGKETLSMQRPKGEWYHAIGQGMGKTIGYATEKGGYTLTDRGTYYAYTAGDKPRTDLVILSEGDKGLFNPYGVITVNSEKHPGVDAEAAQQYLDWITSPEVQAMIGAFTKDGKVLFFPDSK